MLRLQELETDVKLMEDQEVTWENLVFQELCSDN